MESKRQGKKRNCRLSWAGNSISRGRVDHLCNWGGLVIRKPAQKPDLPGDRLPKGDYVRDLTQR